MSKAYVCDICGKLIVKDPYIRIQKEKYITKNSILVRKNNTELDVCSDCDKRIKLFMKVIRSEWNHD